MKRYISSIAVIVCLQLATLTTAASHNTFWTYVPDDKPDPFKPFIDFYQERPGPFPPAWLSALSEIQSGLKAIVWGDLGNKAMVEDDTGKGYMIEEGARLGPNGGIVVRRISRDHIVVELQPQHASQGAKKEFVLRLIKGEGDEHSSDGCLR